MSTNSPQLAGKPSASPESFEYDLAVFIGRFQPFHAGHAFVVNEALKRAKRVLLLIGSANAPRCHRNPFTYVERAHMARVSVVPELRHRVFTRPLEDAAYNEGQWLLNAQRQVSFAAIEIESIGALDQVNRVALIGHSKDETSYYLKLFPQWESINVANHMSLSATPMREEYFSDRCDTWIQARYLDKTVPGPVLQFLADFSTRAEYAEIRSEYEFIQRYRDQWKAAPYAPTFVTVDACVVQSGHILLVRRKEIPGRGLWALPGGFLDPSETVEAGMLRELREETKIVIPTPVLRGSIVTSRVFDAPNRSARGRTITHGVLIHLKPEETLPKLKKRRPNGSGPDLPVVEGADDAEKAQWWPISHVTREMMFEDHMDIISHLVAQI